MDRDEILAGPPRAGRDSAVDDRDRRLARTARAWDEVAAGYETYFVPRFAPWVTTAVAAVTSATLPPGPVLVPCCGTFPELDALIRHLPDREIVGIDLSPGMVRRARDRAAPWPRVSVVEGDASTLAPHWTGRCAAVVSVFGLQQLPEPEHAIRSWVAALRPAGRLSVAFWPDVTEPHGPFALVGEVVAARLPAGNASWERRLASAATAQGAIVERNEAVAHPISHDDARAFFDAYTSSGPMRALAIAHGDAFIDQLRDEFLRRAPAGQWHHRPRARLLVATRESTA